MDFQVEQLTDHHNNTKNVITFLCPCDEKNEEFKPIQLWKHEIKISKYLQTLVQDCCCTEEEDGGDDEDDEKNPIRLTLSYSVLRHLLWYFKECQGISLCQDIHFDLDSLEQEEKIWNSFERYSIQISPPGEQVFQWLDQLRQENTRMDFFKLFFRLRKGAKYLLLKGLCGYMDYWFYSYFFWDQTIQTMEKDIEMICRLKNKPYRPFEFHFDNSNHTNMSVD